PRQGAHPDRRLQRRFRHALFRRDRRHGGRPRHRAPRPPPKTRREHPHRGLALPGAARRQPSRLYAARRQAQIVRDKWGLSPFISPFIAGVLTVAAFAPLGLYPLAPLALAWLVHWWGGAPPRGGFWVGYPVCVW